MLISVGSMPIPDQILTFGFGLRIMVGFGPPREYFPTFSNTTLPIGFTFWAKSMVGHGSMIIRLSRLNSFTLACIRLNPHYHA
jgi:hypothetical protein